MKQPIDGTQIVSRETQERLEAFTALLLAWNRTINLIARGDEANVWQRHIVDSLQLIPHIPAQANSAIDLGSGGGLPGLVLAIATGLPFTLIESDQRKCAFLREATRATAAQVTVLCERIERAELVGRNGNTLVALTLTDIASGPIVATKPMWVAGPNARSGDLAEQNQAVIADLLRLAGQPLEGGTAALLASLAGLRFMGDLGIERDQTANPFNSLHGAEPADPSESVRDD